MPSPFIFLDTLRFHRVCEGTVPSSTTNWTVFNFGNASVMGEFQVCRIPSFPDAMDII